MDKNERKNRIEQVIIAFLSPEYFSITDESEHHRGHIGSPGTGESHYSIIVKSNKFIGKSRVEREKMVHKLLAEEFKSGLHALSMKLEIP